MLSAALCATYRVSSTSRRRRPEWIALALVGVALAATATSGLVRGGQEPRSAPPGATAAATQAAGGDPVVRLLVAGDVGTGDEQARRTAARGGARGWDALVLLGDNIYDDGDPGRAQAAVLQPFRPVLQPGVPLIAALGNHDTDSGNGPAQLDALGQPGPWFARRSGPVLLVVLDSNRPDDPDQLSWLRQTLERDDATWTVAAMHHPMRSAGYHGSDPEARAAFAPLFKQYGVQLALTGHDYQRTRSIDGTTYLVSGAAAKLRPA